MMTADIGVTSRDQGRASTGVRASGLTKEPIRRTSLTQNIILGNNGQQLADVTSPNGSRLTVDY